MSPDHKSKANGERKSPVQLNITKKVAILASVAIVAATLHFLPNHHVANWTKPLADNKSSGVAGPYKSYLGQLTGERDVGAEVWNVINTLNLHEDMTDYVDRLGHKFSFIQPFVGGYENKSTDQNNYKATEIYYDEKTDIQYVLFEFDNTDCPDDMAIDFSISYDMDKLMTNRTVGLPAYQPYLSEKVKVNMLERKDGGPALWETISVSAPIDEIITDDPQLVDFAKDITSFQDLARKSDEHFWELGIINNGGAGYHRDENHTRTQSDSETFQKGGDCLDLGDYLASVALKSNIDGLGGVDTIAGVQDEGLHAVDQVEMPNGFHYIDATRFDYMANMGLHYDVRVKFVPVVDRRYVYNGPGRQVYRDLCSECQTDFSLPLLTYNDDFNVTVQPKP